MSVANQSMFGIIPEITNNFGIPIITIMVVTAIIAVVIAIIRIIVTRVDNNIATTINDELDTIKDDELDDEDGTVEQEMQRCIKIKETKQNNIKQPEPSEDYFNKEL